MTRMEPVLTKLPYDMDSWYIGTVVQSSRVPLFPALEPCHPLGTPLCRGFRLAYDD